MLIKLLDLVQSLSWLDVSMWSSMTFYFVCFIPQIIKNFKLKSGSGVSEFLLLLYLNSYLLLMFYIFGLSLPLAYRILVPLQGLATVVLIVQRLYYEPVLQLIALYAANIVAAASVIPLAIKNPVAIGSLFGWLAFAVILFNQLPQAIKVYREKSVAGFSFLFVFFTGLAAIIETAAAFAAPLPAQTQCTALRGVVMFVIFCWQFVLYRW